MNAMVAGYDSADTLNARYVHGSNAEADDPLVWYSGAGLTSVYYLHADRLGSIVAITDKFASSYAKNAYDEYGVPAAGNSGRFQYTGQMWLPQLGMYYYKGRFYSAQLGRFMQIDPIGYDGGINLYEYVGGDPVNGVDPSGNVLWPWENPVSVMMGQGPAGRATPAQQAHYIAVINRVLATPRGAELLTKIVGPWWRHGDPQTVVLTPGVGSRGTGVLPGGTIQIDPAFHPQTKTAAGVVIASDERIVGHELGHAVTGTGDTPNPGNRMDNINQNENPIVTSLGLSPRTQYLRPPPDNKAKPEIPRNREICILTCK